MSTHKAFQTRLEDEAISRKLKDWSEQVPLPADGREQLLACAAEEACRKEPFSMERVISALWDLFAYDAAQSMIAPTAPKEMRFFDSRGDKSPFGMSVYALQNAITVGACLVRTN